MEQRPTTLDQVQQQWNPKKEPSQEVCQGLSLIDQIYDHIRDNRILPSTMQIEIRETVERGLQNIDEDVKEEMKQNQQIKNEIYEQVDNEDVKVQDEVEMKIDDENFYVAIDLRKYTSENYDICIINQDHLVQVFDNVLKPAFARVIDQVNSQSKLGLSVGVMNRIGQIIRTNIIHPNNYQDPEEVVDLLLDKILENFNKYEKQADDNYTTYLGQDFRYMIVWYTTNVLENQQRIGNIWKPVDIQNEKYLFVDTKSKTNCVFNSIYITKQWNDLFYAKQVQLQEPNNDAKQKLWFMGVLTNQEQRQMLSKKFKERSGFNQDYSRKLISELDIQHITNQLKLNVILYDNQLQKISKIENNKKYEWIKIMIYQGSHAIPMISMKQLKQVYNEDELKVITENNRPELIRKLHTYLENNKQKEELSKRVQVPDPNQQQEESIQSDEDSLNPWTKSPDSEKRRSLFESQTNKPQIIKSPKMKEVGLIEETVVSWDLETYTFNQRPYVYLSGLRYNDKQGQKQFKQFKGDLIDNQINLRVFWKYITDNVEEFDRKIFYAHCGGRFDINLLIRDILNKDSNCVVCSKSTIEINGKWISFGVYIKREGQRPAYIEFRDSYNLMPLTLKKVTKSFCREYIKTELDHRKINMIVDKIHSRRQISQNNEDSVNPWTRSPDSKYKPVDINEYMENGDDQELLNKLKEFMNLAEPYHEIDCQSLFEALCNLDVMFRDEIHLSILSAKTISGLAKLYYLGQYYKKENYIVKEKCPKTGEDIEKQKTKYTHPIFKLSYDQDLFIRKSYKGGMNMCNYYGFVNHQKLYYYDFNSHYPNCGRKDLPYGYPVPIHFGQNQEKHKCTKISQLFAQHQFDQPKLECGCYKGVEPNIMDFCTKGQAGIFEVIIAGNKSQLKCKIPYVSVKDETNNDILCYPFIEKPRIETLTKPEIMYANSQGYQIIVLQGYKFQQAPILKEMFENLYEFKANAKANKDSCKELMFKLMINSGYGWLGLNTYKSSKVLFTSKQSKEYLDYMENGLLQSITQWPNNKVLRVGGSFQKDADCNVAIASYITAYARIELHKIASAIQKKGHNIYYMDTDSLITTCNLSDPKNQDLIKLTRPNDKECTKLGSLKNERGMNFNQDGTTEDLYFTDAIFVGCKNYGLKDQEFIDQFKQQVQQVDGKLFIQDQRSPFLLELDEDEFVTQFKLTDLQKKQVLHNYRTFDKEKKKLLDDKFDVEIKETLCYRSDLEFEQVEKSLCDYADVQSNRLNDDKIIRFETNEPINQELMEKLQIQQIHKYVYSSDKHKYICKKLKGFSQNNSDKKLKYNLYEDMCKLNFNEETQKYEHQTIYQQTNRINIPKYTFVRDVNQIQGSQLESFQMTIEDNIKKQFKMIYETKGILDENGFLIQKTI